MLFGCCYLWYGCVIIDSARELSSAPHFLYSESDKFAHKRTHTHIAMRPSALLQAADGICSSLVTGSRVFTCVFAVCIHVSIFGKPVVWL